jgi:alkylhydroperoxidase/carboxymuconolactone decarboxylase family protein YurZ
MIRFAIKHGIRGMERSLGVTLEYLREVGRVLPGALPRLAFFVPLVRYRRALPASVLNVARIGATLSQDCGECLQIAVNVALQEGVPRHTVEAAVRGDADALEDAEAEALAFAERVGTGLDANAEREWVRRRFGDAGVVELSIAVASAHVFPVLKRGMGYAQACRIDAVRYAA